MLDRFRSRHLDAYGFGYAAKATQARRDRVLAAELVRRFGARAPQIVDRAFRSAVLVDLGMHGLSLVSNYASDLANGASSKLPLQLVCGGSSRPTRRPHGASATSSTSLLSRDVLVAPERRGPSGPAGARHGDARPAAGRLSRGGAA